MSRILIGIPTIDKVDASFMTSVMGMDLSDGNEYAFTTRCNSLIYNGRSSMAIEAVNGKYDWLVMIDSDMVLERDTIRRLVEGVQDKHFLTALYFRRRLPTGPLILKELDWYESEYGPMEIAEAYEDYPRGEVFQIQGCGFGCCIMSVEMVRKLGIAYRMNPWTPLPRLSEDFAFCYRAIKQGYKLYCDSSLLPGHVGTHVYTQSDWDRQRNGALENG